MSVAVGVPLLEAIYCLACTRWAYKRCVYTGAQDSGSWSVAEAHELEPIPRMCQLVLAVYERDLQHPQWAPPGGYNICLETVVKKTIQERIVPPYLIYVDHEHREIVLAIRGLNLRRENDYLVLWDNKLGRQEFLDGYVHHGLLRAAVWLLYQEKETLRECIAANPSYTLTFTGHSLGSGVAALMAVLAIQFPFLLADIQRKQIRCYAIAPARCMSLNLAVKFADVVYSVVLQDDFLPRTATPLEDIFKSIFCLPCLLGYRCLRDTCVSEEKLLRDPRRLYASGRMYHIVERAFCSCCWKHPPVVKTGIPVEGRFEHIVLSCNAMSDHSIVAILRESEKALQAMRDTESETQTPPTQKMTRQQTRAKEYDEEHKAALKRAATLEVPSATYESSSEDANNENETGAANGDANANEDRPLTVAQAEAGELRAKIEWDDLLDKLFRKDDTGNFVWR